MLRARGGDGALVVGIGDGLIVAAHREQRAERSAPPLLVAEVAKQPSLRRHQPEAARGREERVHERVAGGIALDAIEQRVRRTRVAELDQGVDGLLLRRAAEHGHERLERGRVLLAGELYGRALAHVAEPRAEHAPEGLARTFAGLIEPREASHRALACPRRPRLEPGGEHRLPAHQLGEQLPRLVFEPVGVAEEHLLQHPAPRRRVAAAPIIGRQQREPEHAHVALPDRERLRAQLRRAHPQR